MLKEERRLLKVKKERKRVKKRQIDVIHESFKDVIEHVTEVQKASDKIYIELEEKHMSLEKHNIKGK